MIGTAVDAPTPRKDGHSARSAKAAADPLAKPVEQTAPSAEAFAIRLEPRAVLGPVGLPWNLPVSGTDNSGPDLHEKTSAAMDPAAAPQAGARVEMAPVGKLAFGLDLSVTENLAPVPNPLVSAPAEPLNRDGAALNISDAALHGQQRVQVFAIGDNQARRQTATTPLPRFISLWPRSPLPAAVPKETSQPTRPMPQSPPDNARQGEETAGTASPQNASRFPQSSGQTAVKPTESESAPIAIVPSTGDGRVASWAKAQQEPAARPVVFSASSPWLAEGPVSATESESVPDKTPTSAPTGRGLSQSFSPIASGRPRAKEVVPREPTESRRGWGVPPEPRRVDAGSAASEMASPSKQNQRDAGPVATPPIITPGNKDIPELAARPSIDGGIPAIRQEPAASRNAEHVPAATVAESSPVEAKTNSMPLRPAREVLLRVKSEDSQNVNVQLRQRGAGVEIAVRSDNPGLARALQSDLSELVGRLENHGFKTQAWTPSDTSHLNVVQPGASTASEDRSSGSGRHQDPQEQKDQRQQKQDSPERRPAPGAAAWAATWNRMLSREDGKVL